MVTWARILLVGCVVFFVDHYNAQILKRRKNGRTSSYGNRNLFVSNFFSIRRNVLFASIRYEERRPDHQTAGGIVQRFVELARFQGLPLRQIYLGRVRAECSEDRFLFCRFPLLHVIGKAETPNSRWIVWALYSIYLAPYLVGVGFQRSILAPHSIESIPSLFF